MTPRFLTTLLLAGLAGCSDHSDVVIEASGTIEGTEFRVATEVAGRILSIACDEGTLVKEGDTLIVIDDTEYRIQLRQSVASAEVAEAGYRLALEGSRKEDILQAEAAFDAAKADFERVRDLLASGTVTQKQYDDSYTRFVASEQGYAKLASGLRSQEIVAARALRDQAEAAADQLRKRIRDCAILSPANGIVTLKAVERGELTGVGGNLLRVTSLDPAKLVIYIGETDLGRIRLGQAAGVFIDAFPQREFSGTVTYISSVAEFTPKNVQTKEERTKLVFSVKVNIPNPEGILKPGMPADARLQIQFRESETK